MSTPRSFLRDLIVTLVAVLLMTVTPHLSAAQIQHGGTPYSFGHTVQGNVPAETMRPVDVQALKQEDRANRQSDNPAPPRFGAALDVSLGLQNAGQWTDLSDGGRLWRLRIASQAAHSLNFIFDRFRLPEGGKLFLYNQDHSTVLGAFTAANNKSYGRFSTLPVEGDIITLEYYEPKNARGETQLRLAKVVHGYRDMFPSDTEKQSDMNTNGFGDSESCNINVNCPEGNDWQEEKRSVAMVLLGDGTRWCSGALVNNKGGNLNPYFLSAHHCADYINQNGVIGSDEKSDIQDWTFWFNYESSSCSNPNNEPYHDGISGAQFQAARDESDFLLLELSDQPPLDYDAYFSGWDASGSSSNSTTSIHHPVGDIKKISIDNNSPSSDNFAGTPSNSHWLVDFDDGTVEGVSSGAPLFSPDNKVIGQLHGGTSGPFVDRCEVRDGYYGKFSWSWNKGGNNTTRLKDWLDPNDTGTITLNGIDPFLYVNVPQPAPEVDEYEPITFNASVNSNVDRSPYTYSWDRRQCQSCEWQSVCSGGSSCTTSFSDNTDGDALASVRVYVYDDEGETHTDKTDIVVNEQDGSGGDECQYGNQNPNYICPKSTTTRQGTPDAFALQPPSPNPVAQQTSIRFALPEKQHVSLVVYDLMGRTVAELVNQTKPAGYHRVSFTPDGLGSGVYVYRITAGPHHDTRRMTVVK